MSDDEFLDLMDALWGVGGGDSLWAIALEDSDPEPAVIDPAMEARAARDIAAADLLAAPAFEDVEVPSSLWSETNALEDRFFGDLLAGPLPPGRDDYQPRFPIDPDEEVTW